MDCSLVASVCSIGSRDRNRQRVRIGLHWFDGISDSFYNTPVNEMSSVVSSDNLSQ